MGYPKNGLSPEFDNNHDDVLLGAAVEVGGRGSKFSNSSSGMCKGGVGCIGSSRSAKDGRDPPNSIGSLSNIIPKFGNDRRTNYLEVKRMQSNTLSILYSTEKIFERGWFQGVNV